MEIMTINKLETLSQKTSKNQNKWNKKSWNYLNVVDQLQVSQVTHSDKRLKNKMIDAKFYTITVELMLIMISWQ